MRLPALKLRRGDRDVLESWTRAGTIEARLAKRARIVLAAADAMSNRDIGEMVEMHYNQVAVWRRRYAEFGLAGLGDEERSGRPCVYGHDDVLLLVKTVTEPPPGPATRWTMDALAAAMAAHGVPMSASQCWRICRALDLKPWQVESVTQAATPPSWTFNPAKSTTMPLRSYSNSRRSRTPGTAGRVGLIRALAWIEVFSSTDHTTALEGGFRYNAHTSAAFSQKSGSWLVIHDSTCQDFRARAPQIRQHCDAEIGTLWLAMAAASASVVQRVA